MELETKNQQNPIDSIPHLKGEISKHIKKSLSCIYNSTIYDVCGNAIERHFNEDRYNRYSHDCLVKATGNLITITINSYKFLGDDSGWLPKLRGTLKWDRNVRDIIYITFQDSFSFPLIKKWIGKEPTVHESSITWDPYFDPVANKIDELLV